MPQVHGSIKSGLTPKGGKERVRLLLLNDLPNHLRCDRFDIGPIRKLRIGHNGGRIGVHQDYFVALFP